MSQKAWSHLIFRREDGTVQAVWAKPVFVFVMGFLYVCAMLAGLGGGLLLQYYARIIK